MAQLCRWTKIRTKQWLVLGVSDFQCMCVGFLWQNSSQWWLRNVQLLRTTVNWCWWRFTRTFCHSSKILGCMHCFWLFTLCFIDERMLVSFTFFHKITNIQSWRCFSSSKIRTQFSHTFCNITMIFKVMSQYFLAFFKYIHNHPCSFGGRIKLIICKIKHELGVTIHEISTSWRKKKLDGGPYRNQKPVISRQTTFAYCSLEGATMLRPYNMLSCSMWEYPYKILS